MAFPTITAILGAVFGSGAVTGATGWIYNLGNRVTKLETKQEDLPALIEAKFDVVNISLDSIGGRLDRIERAMNGTLKGH